MSAEKRPGPGRSRKLVLTTEGKKEVAKGQYRAAFQAIKRLEGAQPRNGSMADLQTFSEFAGELQVEYAAASKAKVLDDLDVLLPGVPHLSSALVERLQRTIDGLPAPKIPGITALIMQPGESGWRMSIVGSNHVKPRSK